MHHRMSLHPFVILACVLIVAVVVISALFSAFTLPYGMMKLWTLSPTLGALVPALPLLLITAATTAYGLWYTPAPALRKDRAEIFTSKWLLETVVVALAGPAFIWVIMLLGAWALAFVDQIAGGFIGLHAIRSLQNGIVGPFADTLSFGFVTGLVNDPVRWAVSAVAVGFAVHGALNQMWSHTKEGWSPLAALTGLATGWIADLTALYVLFAYGLWSTMIVVLVLKVTMDAIRYAHWRNEGGVELLPPQR